MRNVLKICHIISRVLVFACVAAALLLLFVRPEGIGYGTADPRFWKEFSLVFSLAAVMFAASDWAYRVLEDNDFLEILSSSILAPVFERHDISDKRFQKAAADELEFNAGLRMISDSKERALQELAWEKKNNRRLQKKTVVSGIVSLAFFVVAMLFLLYPVIAFLVTGHVMELPGQDLLASFAVGAVVLTFLIIFDYTGYQRVQRRLNTVLSIRSRCDAVYESERTDLIRPKQLPGVRPTASAAAASAASEAGAQKKPFSFSAGKTPAAAASPVILPEEEPAAASAPSGFAAADAAAAADEAAEPAPEYPAVPPEEIWNTTGQAAGTSFDAKESPFESLTPEEDAPEA